MEYAEQVYTNWSNTKEDKEELEWEDVKNIIYEAAKSTKMSTKSRNGRGWGNKRREWYNDECKEKREIVWKKLKMMLKESEKSDRKKEYAEAKKIYKKNN
ncbi:Protein of unknown function [Cotesia congregata]|uniref:Uncharacterized protein n=1 Tax=Cotesia congregata TaxID=51543 RepID=A0A8J2MSX5_COTCN|nr:Protein of unknown function [Cotesia congregata]